MIGLMATTVWSNNVCHISDPLLHFNFPREQLHEEAFGYPEPMLNVGFACGMTPRDIVAVITVSVVTVTSNQSIG